MTLLPQRKSYSVQLSRVRPADIPSLIQVLDDAFAPNLFDQLINTSMPDRAAQLKKDLLEYLSMPNVVIIKAEIGSAEHENTDSRQIVGWSVWGWSVLDKESGHNKERRSAPPNMSTVVLHGWNPPAGSLGALFRDAEIQWEQQWFANRDQMVLALLCVAPKFQGRGIGEKLLEYGVEQADRRNLICHLTATPVAWKVYARYGWHVVEEQKIDLSEWFSSGGRERRGSDQTALDMGYGCYVWRRMIRVPERDKGIAQQV